MKILITNDDGIESPGILALLNTFSDHELYVCAPQSCKSASSMSMTIRGNVTAKKYDLPHANLSMGVDGTTVDCVKIALSALDIPKPDLVLSGVNLGMNIARDLHYSATVGGALEAALSGIPSIALSAEYQGNDDPPVIDAATVLKSEWDKVLAKISDSTHPLFANINVPATKFKGIAYTSVSKVPVFLDKYKVAEEGFEHAGSRDEDHDDMTEDLGAINQGHASISFVTPKF